MRHGSELQWTVESKAKSFHWGSLLNKNHQLHKKCVEPNFRLTLNGSVKGKLMHCGTLWKFTPCRTWIYKVYTVELYESFHNAWLLNKQVWPVDLYEMFKPKWAIHIVYGMSFEI